MDLLHRTAAIAPTSLNPQARTVEVVFSTGARVARYGTWAEPFIEELSLEPKHVRLDRLRSGSAPVLNSHNATDVDAVVGVVTAARLAPGRGLATLRFAANDPKADAVWNKITQGILRNISVGYRVHKFEETGATDGKLPIRKATDWEPHEISIVPMGADSGAVVRSEEIRTMHPETTSPSPIEAERERAAAITAQCRTTGFPEFAERFIREGLTTEQVAGRVLEAMRVRGMDHLGPRPGPSGVRVMEAGLEGQEFRHAAVDALLQRAGVVVSRPHPAAQDLTPSIHELARICCSRAGLRSTGSIELLLRNAMTTSDFPLLLADSAGKALRQGFEEEPASHREWVRVVPVRDFKTVKRPILGSAPDLEQVLELGEYQQGPLSEASESYAIEKFGRIVALSWETLVNDDLDAFLRLVPALGQAARRKEADVVYTMLTSNSFAGPTLSDSLALFHATHANITTAATALDATVLNEARALLRKQTALGGGVMNLTPRFLIVSPEHETTAEQLLASATRVRIGTTTAGSESARPEWIGRLTLVVEARLSEDHAYLATTPTQVDTVEMGVLEENMGGPMIVREDSFIQDRIAWKVRHAFSAAALDYRGLVRIDLDGVS